MTSILGKLEMAKVTTIIGRGSTCYYTTPMMKKQRGHSTKIESLLRLVGFTEGYM
jgi:hypothetical protein